MSVIVTGGAGFIGSHVVDRYWGNGQDVTVIDDLSTGHKGNLPAGVELHQLSITSSDVSDLIERIRPEVVVHCAAQISVPVSMARPLEDLEINVLGTSRLVSACKRAGVGRFVFISSGGAIYGETRGPATEITLPNPASFYGVHKLAAEYHVILSGLSYSILRPSNVFGPRQRNDQEGGVVSIFVDAAIQRNPITIYGNGEQQRDFIHVDDVVEAVEKTADIDVNGVWNVSTSVVTTINELAEITESVTDFHIERKRAPARPGDVLYSCLDSSQIQRDLGWRPNVSLRDGLEQMLAHRTG